MWYGYKDKEEYEDDHFLWRSNLICTYADFLHLNKLPLKSMFFKKNLLNFWRSLFGEANSGTLSHQGWTKNPAYPEPSQTSKKELSEKVVNGLEPLTIFAKRRSTEFWILLWPRYGCLLTETHWANILIHLTQLCIENIVPNFEKPSTKDMRIKRIPSKHLTAQSQQQKEV